MNDSVVDHIRISWEYINVDNGRDMMIFYDKLFEKAPETRKFFTGSIEKQSEKLAYTLGFIVANINRIEDIKSSLEELGRVHNQLHIAPHYYDIVRDCLLETIQYKMADNYRTEIGESWRIALDHISSIMINAPQKRAFEFKKLLARLFAQTLQPN